MKVKVGGKMKVKVDYAEYGFDGILYPVEKRLDKVLIIVSGSEGGLDHPKKMAAFFRQNGVPALAVGYFKTKHTAKNLAKVPVEIIDRAVSYLQELGYEKIGIQGLSKGTEYAMLAAIRNAAITCVILKTPSWFYSEGLAGKQPSGCSCWTADGAEVPYTPYKIRKFDIIASFKETGEYNLLKINSGKTVADESVIPVEKVNGPVLICSTKSDNVWPSAESGEKLYARLSAKGFAHPFEHICYERMCHIMMENANSMTRLISKSEKQYPAECAAERQDMAEKVLNWIENVW